MTMLQPTVVPNEFDLQVPSGRIHAERFGPEDAPLALCIPGLSANLKSFDFLGERLASDALQVVAIDLRGRGRSEVTPPGTYGWVNHARDVFAVADALGARRFSLIGQSMGGAVAMTAAWLDASRIERIALLDIAGRPDESVLGPIGAAVSRLGAVYPSVDAYVRLVRQIGTIEPWSDYWQRYFEYELQPVEGGVASSTDRAAVLEDGAFGAGAYVYGGDAGVYGGWKALSMPVLLLRATRELLPGLGHVVPEADRDRFLREVPGARSVEVDANHYGINTHEDSARAIAEFLGVALRR
jgi:pimeloyl-ACP methyl ester carboxylesterase